MGSAHWAASRSQPERAAQKWRFRSLGATFASLICAQHSNAFAGPSRRLLKLPPEPLGYVPIRERDFLRLRQSQRSGYNSPLPSPTRHSLASTNRLVNAAALVRENFTFARGRIKSCSQIRFDSQQRMAWPSAGRNKTQDKANNSAGSFHFTFAQHFPKTGCCALKIVNLVQSRSLSICNNNNSSTASGKDPARKRMAIALNGA